VEAAVPDTSPFAIVSGPSQRSYAIAASISFWLAAALAAFNVVALSVGAWRVVLGSIRGWATGATLLDAVVLAVLIILHRIQGSREAQAGYTTLTRGRIDLPQVDPVSGVTLREANSPYLSKQEFKNALERARGEPR
jgi:hypothetical protein